MFSDNVVADPPICAPNVPDDEILPLTARDVVATFANVFTPEKYGMLPTTAAVDVDSPLNPTVTPPRVIGHVTEILFCFPFSVVCRSVPFRDIVPANRLVVEAVANDEYIVDDE